MSLRLSRLSARVGPSGTMAADDRLQRLRAAGRDVVSLGAGQLDFETPAPVARAGTEAIAHGITRYTPVAGTLALRRAVRDKFERENGLVFGDDQVIVGAGAKAVVFHALLALVDPDDAVIVPAPAWPSYGSMVTVAGGRTVSAALSAAEGYRLTPAALRGALAAAGGCARGVILNSPHNPTGALMSREAYAAIAPIVREAGLWVISDEIYEHLVYDGTFTSFAALDGMGARTLTVNGVSKAFAMTGWRIGYAGGPAELIQAMEALQSHTSGNPSSISQHAAEAALRLCVAGDAEMAAERRRFQDALVARRDLACRILGGIPGVTLVRPAGAFYVFADVSRHFGRTLAGRRVAGSADLADLLMEQAGVAVVPGQVFGDDRGVRVSFAASPGELTVALDRLAQALA
ncbi:MAG: pyridoxal phosphate-dependent aminotransferase [Candidatus Eisenbacteria bacterium]|uniref:Aminotransferase n=1 Tax=Eiseniibacteriota bacterium TaxID=2212470 RepID=A0A538U486_UNCEI|nr:MAG: pyridoxal phosphate-dependent aminotransferase [Candidatus Eisenbacteria bacterium]